MEELGFDELEDVDEVLSYMNDNNISYFITKCYLSYPIYCGGFSYKFILKSDDKLYSKKLFKRGYYTRRKYKTKTTFYDEMSNFEGFENLTFESVPWNDELDCDKILTDEEKINELCPKIISKLPRYNRAKSARK